MKARQSIKIDNKQCILPMETNEKTIKHHVLLSRAIKVFDVPDRVMIKDSELIFKKNGGGRGQYKSFIKKNVFSDLSFDKLLFIFSFFFLPFSLSESWNTTGGICRNQISVGHKVFNCQRTALSWKKCFQMLLLVIVWS